MNEPMKAHSNTPDATPQSGTNSLACVQALPSRFALGHAHEKQDAHGLKGAGLELWPDPRRHPGFGSKQGQDGLALPVWKSFRAGVESAYTPLRRAGRSATAAWSAPLPVRLLAGWAAALVLQAPVWASGGITVNVAGGSPAGEQRASAAAHSTSPNQSKADELKASHQALMQMIVLRCSRNSDCATLGIGVRACGGPAQYVAYAVAATPAAPLQRAAERYAGLRKKQLEDSGEMSTCEVLPDPGASCSSAGQCRLQHQAGGQRGAAPGAAAR
jgi:hypothetical protein